MERKKKNSKGSEEWETVRNCENMIIVNSASTEVSRLFFLIDFSGIWTGWQKVNT